MPREERPKGQAGHASGEGRRRQGKPGKREEGNDRSSATLRNHREKLEMLVNERTLELERTNRKLRQEISSRRLAEQAVSRGEERFKSFLDNLGDLAYEADAHGNVTYANRAAEKVTGKPLRHIIGKPFLRFFEEASQETAADAYRRTLNGESPEYELTFTNGRVYLFKNEPLKDGTGKIIGVLGTARDITGRKQVENSLRESEERFRAVFEGSLDAIFISDPESGIILDANPAASELLQLPLESIVGTHHTRHYPVSSRESAEELFDRLARFEDTADPVEIRVLCGDGSEKPVEVLAQLIQIGGKPVLHSLLRDTRVRKRAETALRESEERYRSFFEGSPIPLWEVDASEVKRHTNALRNSGVLDLGAYFDRHPEEALQCWRKARVVEMNRACLALFEATSKEEIREVHRRVLPKEGYSGFIGGVLAIAEGKTSSERYVTGRTLKGREKHVHYRWSVVPGHENTFSRMLVSIVDVTDRVRLERELLRVQKLESIGILAGGIAHDFNNLLTAISTNLSMARMYGNLQEDVSEMLRDAEKASSRAKSLTQQLLAFAKGGKPIKKTVSIRELLVDMVEFALSGSNVRSEYSFPEDLWNVSVDEGQIGQVIHNLVINAVHAMPNGGTVQVSAENILIDRQGQLPLNEGKYVSVSIRDHGIGISKKHLNSVFDPFFTTKQKGSGLGLTTSFTILKNHGGHIRVTSEVDVGTRVEVFLPACEEALEEGKGEKKELPRGRGRVLLIDDEEAILRSASEMLKRFGYDVVPVRDGENGIRSYREARAAGVPFDAVIMDLTIRGGKGGKEIVQELKAIDPDAKVIVCSGYSDDPVMANCREYGFCAVMKKPYQIEEVGKLLREVMSVELG
jgi:PAS domain S-box-containing protein